MTFQIECEKDFDVTFDYKRTAEDIINVTLDYVGCPYDIEINLTLTDNDGIRELNREYRDIDSPTDVLSFPMVDYQSPGDFTGLEDCAEDYFNLDSGELMLGDIIISTEKLKAQAEEYGHSELREFCFLIVHSMLHLFGYDHMEDGERMEMEKHQRLILERAGISR